MKSFRLNRLFNAKSGRCLLLAGIFFAGGVFSAQAEQPAPVVKSAAPFGLARGPLVIDAVALRGDFDVTYGDPAGQRTRLRSYWNNQHTGSVDDAVFELMLEPKNFGELEFRN